MRAHDRLNPLLLIAFAFLVQWTVQLLRRVPWGKVASVLAMALPFMLAGGVSAFAVGPGTVNYVAPTGVASSAATTMTNAVEQIAGVIRWVLGGTGLLALIVAAVMNHVPNQHTKEQAKEIAMAAVVGLLIAAFAPSIINFFMGLG